VEHGNMYDTTRKDDHLTFDNEEGHVRHLLNFVGRHVHRNVASTNTDTTTNDISILDPIQYHTKDECTDFFQQYTIIVLLIVSGVFFLFTFVMILEQIDTIRTGKGKIARMKQRVGDTGTELDTVTEEFNEMFGGTSPNVAWHWFLPIPVRYPKHMKQVVLGYEYNPNTCVPGVPYGMECTTSCSDTSILNGCDESIPLSRTSSNIGHNSMESPDLESNMTYVPTLPMMIHEKDGLMKTIAKKKTPPQTSPPPMIPIPSSLSSSGGDGIFRREVSTDSNSTSNSTATTLNRRTNRHGPTASSATNTNTASTKMTLDHDGDGITLVERSGRSRLT
jgi:hypothetical protein